MKKILSIIVLLAGVISFTSCDDADTSNPYGSESVIQIVKADSLIFNSMGGEGYIEFIAPSNVEITSNSDWVTLSRVSDTRVAVAVASNEKKGDRSAQVKFVSNGDVVMVTVHQFGLLLRADIPASLKLGNTGASTSTTFDINHSHDVIVETTASWLHASVMGDQLTIFADNNTKKVIRHAMVKYSSGEYSDSVEVYQGEMSDLVGKTFSIVGWDIFAEEDAPLEEQILEVTLKVNSSSEGELTIPTAGLSGMKATIKLNSDLMSLDIFASHLGAFGRSYLALLPFDAFGGAFSASEEVSFGFPLNYIEDDEEEGYHAQITDNGSLKGYTINGFLIGSYSDSKYEKRTGFVAGMYDCELSEATADEEARASFVKQAKANKIALRTLRRR